MQKMIVRLIPILPANLATCEENLIVCAYVWTPINRKPKIGKISDIVFLSFPHIAHLLCKDGHFSVGGLESAYP